MFLLSSLGKGGNAAVKFKLLCISKLEKSVYVSVRERVSEREQEEVNHLFFKSRKFAVRELNFEGFEKE